MANHGMIVAQVDYACMHTNAVQIHVKEKCAYVHVHTLSLAYMTLLYPNYNVKQQ